MRRCLPVLSTLIFLFACQSGLAGVAVPTAPLWSLQPFAIKPLPQVRHSEWPHSRIDHFLLARLEQEGLGPNADATPATLMRRLYFDLIGLPPPVAAVEDFERSPHPQSSWALIVDSLLASPEFGARWGRHWLDVARYAETSGNTRNMAYVLAWRYRNYVVRAFNRDTPFDEFVREQIAGDLLPPSSHPLRRDDQLLATGFLNVGVKSLGEQDKLLYDMNVADDQIDATCHAFLGLSANCARCHDHKFDPIPTTDYHALAGIFRSTQNLSGVQTNNVTKEAEAMPLGMDGPQRMTAIKKHEKELSDMQKGYEDLAKKRNTMRDELVKVGFDPAKIVKPPDTMPKEMVGKMIAVTTLSKDVEEWKLRLADKQKRTPPTPPLGMSVRESEAPMDCPVYEKGEIKKPLAPVKRGALSALPVKLAAIGEKESGRRQLADWIASPHNPLTARVIVNRVWLHLFGRGIVDTPDDFGRMGSKPSHPELLDDLAARFVRDGWGIKSLIRELVLSRAYRMDSGNGAGQAIDPANILLWRANKKRLEAEPLRDAILDLGGTLDVRPREGSPIADLAQPITPQGREVGRKHFLNDLKDDTTHRSIYLPIVRGAQMPMMQCFNAADPGLVIGARSVSITPAQSLVLMNSDIVMNQAQGLARRILATAGGTDEHLIRAWRMTCARQPTAGELDTLRGFIAATGDNAAGWTQLCHALMQSGEFQTIY